jgi:hypothetical protein
MHPTLVAAVLAMAAAGACAPGPSAAPMRTAAAPGQQCFDADDVNGFRPFGRKSVDLTVTGKGVYRAEVFGLCPDLDSAGGLGVQARSGRWVCDAADLEMVVPSPELGARRCPVRSLRQLAQAEIDAARKR